MFDDISLSKDWQQCDDFANASDYSEYAKRNQKNKWHMVQQNIVGKAAEVAVYKALYTLCNISKPDFAIYSAKKKSWSADLIITKKHKKTDIHVKGQSVEQARIFEVSWIFQSSNKSGKGGKDRIFNKDARGSVAFVLVDEENKSAKILAIVPIILLKKMDLFQDPAKESLKGIKKAIYHNHPTKPSLVTCGLAGLEGFLNIKAGKY